MDKITGEEPAFPFWTWNEAGYGNAVVMYGADGSKSFNSFTTGMTIRQYFAAKAMQGLLAETFINLNQASVLAVEQADNLITRLNEISNPNNK